MRAFESGAVPCSEGAVSEYVRALVKLDALDGSRLLSTLTRGADAGFAARGLDGLASASAPAAAAAAAAAAPPAMGGAPWYAAGYGAGGGGGSGGGAGPFGGMGAHALAALGAAGLSGGGGGGEIGTNRNPLVITHAEPSLMSQARGCMFFARGMRGVLCRRAQHIILHARGI